MKFSDFATRNAPSTTRRRLTDPQMRLGSCSEEMEMVTSQAWVAGDWGITPRAGGVLRQTISLVGKRLNVAHEGRHLEAFSGLAGIMQIN